MKRLFLALVTVFLFYDTTFAQKEKTPLNAVPEDYLHVSVIEELIRNQPSMFSISLSYFSGVNNEEYTEGAVPELWLGDTRSLFFTLRPQAGPIPPALSFIFCRDDGRIFGIDTNRKIRVGFQFNRFSNNRAIRKLYFYSGFNLDGGYRGLSKNFELSLGVMINFNLNLL